MLCKVYFCLYSETCFKRPSIQMTWKSLLTGGCLLLHESSAESSCTVASCCIEVVQKAHTFMQQ